MKIHRNAKTTPQMRALIVDRVRRQGWSSPAAATAAGISVRTTQKWLRRYRLGGPTALTDASSRPHRSPRATPSEVVTDMVALRQAGERIWRIARAVGRPASTVSAILRRLGVRRPVPPRPPIHRYEWPHAGDLLHVDIKPLARIAGVGHRIHGDQSHRRRGGGYEYVHVAVDDATRVAYVEVCRSQRGVECAAFLDRACTWFMQMGVGIRRVMSDNGRGYISRAFQTIVAQRALRHVRTRPYTPRTNGKAERFIQTLLREWAYVCPYESSAARTAVLPDWLTFYNCDRPHASLSYATPWTRLRAA
ncbi:MAG TPA: IS481 family transposase [Vicinamibacterales bacterium]